MIAPSGTCATVPAAAAAAPHATARCSPGVRNAIHRRDHGRDHRDARDHAVRELDHRVVAGAGHEAVRLAGGPVRTAQAGRGQTHQAAGHDHQPQQPQRDQRGALERERGDGAPARTRQGGLGGGHGCESLERGVARGRRAPRARPAAESQQPVGARRSRARSRAAVAPPVRRCGPRAAETGRRRGGSRSAARTRAATAVPGRPRAAARARPPRQLQQRAGQVAAGHRRAQLVLKKATSARPASGVQHHPLGRAGSAPA